MADRSSYYTVSHPSEFTIDWVSFYTNAGNSPEETRKKLRTRLNVHYAKSNNPKQTLDIYLPEGEPKSAPVFIFLHGGGFREGDKDDYGYVARPFSSRDVITV